MFADGIEVKTIPGFPDYAISRDGRVWSKSRTTSHGHRHRGRWRKLVKQEKGYYRVMLYEQGVAYVQKVHRLVLETYIGSCPDGMETCHNNGVKTDNHLKNLRWDTRSNNHQDAVRHGTLVSLLMKGEKHPSCKLTEPDVRMIVYMYRTGLFLQKEIAKIYKVSRGNIGNIVNKKKWKHLWATM